MQCRFDFSLFPPFLFPPLFGPQVPENAKLAKEIPLALSRSAAVYISYLGKLPITEQELLLHVLI